MGKKKNRAESLMELVFLGRNREYGAYLLRKKYLKTLIIAAFTGITLILLTVLIPFFIYMIRDIGMDYDMEYVYAVEYLPFAPPEDLELVEMAKAHASPPEEQMQAPVVADTVPPEKEQKPLQDQREDRRDEPEESDTASYGTGGEQIGRQATSDTAVATTIDVYPRFPGGEEARLFYLRRHVNYPKEAVENKIEGVVIVVFVVEPTGEITRVKLLKGIGGGCDEEALRVAREMPKWSPGKRSGRPVRVLVKMPIVFGFLQKK